MSNNRNYSDEQIKAIMSNLAYDISLYSNRLSSSGKPIKWNLCKPQSELFDNGWYQKHWRKNCETCVSRLICNGCSDCGECEK